MNWFFIGVILLHMFYRTVYAVKSKEIVSLTIDPKVNYENGNYLEAGSRKTISCKASNKNQKVEWVDPSGNVVHRLPSNRVFAQEHFVQMSKVRIPALVLIFTHAIVEDSGVWECRSGDVSQNVSLCVIDPSEFVDTATEVTVDRGRSITLTCQARGEPEPRLLWNRSGEIISDDDNSSKYKVMTKYNSQGFEGLLTITSLEPEDSGAYACVAVQESPLVGDCTNTESFNITVNVNYAPIFDDQNDTMLVYGKINESVNLVCQANGFPTPTYRWFKEIGDVLSEFPQNQIQYQEDGNQAILTLKADVATIGQRYRCRATNPQGETDKAFLIVKLVKPNKPKEINSYNATDNAIQLNVTCSEDPSAPYLVDSFDIQYVNKDSLKKRLGSPKEAEWKKGDQVKVELDDMDSEEGVFVTLANLEAETEYWVRLKAVNEAGESSWSDPVLVFTVNKLEPEILEEEEENPSALDISYSDATFYGIFFAGGILVLVVVCTFVMRLV